MFAKVAPMAVLGLAADADEAAIDARASESYISDMLKTMQSQSDKVRTLEGKVKTLEDKNKGDEHTNHDGDDRLDEVLKLLNQQKESSDSLKARIDALEGNGKQKDFDALVAKVGKDLGLDGDLLDLCKARLSSDMDEKAVRDSLGAAKKTLIDKGIKVEEGQQQQTKTEKAKEEADRKEAADWVKEHEIK
jgi:hypothetical protein